MSIEQNLNRMFQESSELMKVGNVLYQLQMNTYSESKYNMLFCLDFDFKKPYYYCQTGMPKTVYHDRLHIPGKTYSALYEYTLAPMLTQALADARIQGNVYMIIDDSKEIGIVFQTSETSDVSPLTFTECIAQQIQSVYEQQFPHGTGRYCNTTVLSDSVCGIEGIRNGYLQTEALKTVSFFRMTPGVLTRERLNSLKNDATYRDVMNLTRVLCRAAAQGEDAKMLSLAERLFLDLLKHSYDMELVHDALSYIKHFLSIRLSIHLPDDQTDLAVLCSAQSYIIIEECYEAILPVMTRLCQAVQRSGIWSDAVADAAYCLRSNLGSDVSLPEIAAFADTTPAYLSSLFHRQTGMTIKQYQQSIRMEQACRLLKTTQDRVTDIAVQTGFVDRRYFTRIFKEAHGMTPQEYRLCAQRAQPDSRNETGDD